MRALIVVYLIQSKSSLSSINQEARARDHLGHFLLRLYYCRNAELRKWFIWHETELLRHRLFDKSNRFLIPKFLAQNNLKYEKVSEEEISDRHLLHCKVNFATSKFSTGNCNLLIVDLVFSFFLVN